jgi:hypothetical protein
MFKVISRVLAIIALVTTHSAYATGTMIYSGLPLPILLNQNQEMLLEFDEPQLVGRTGENYVYADIRSLKNQVIIQSKDENAVFEVQLMGVHTGDIILIKVEIGKFEGIGNHIRIRKSGDAEVIQSSTTQGASNDFGQLEYTADDRAKILVRFVNQVKGPSIAIEDTPFNVNKVAIRGPEPLMGFYRKGKLSVQVEEIYQGGGFTALLLIAQNVSAEKVIFDPTMVRGRWHSVQPWKFSLDPAEKGVIVAVSEGRVPDQLMSLLSEEQR